MNYRTKWNEFDLILKQIKSKKVEKNIIVGISTYNQGSAAVLRRISSTKLSGFAGYSLFSYNYLIENKNYLREIRLKITSGGLNGS
jgi:hypothetical protein